MAKQSKKSNRLSKIAILIVIAAILVFLFFNEYGLLKYYSVNQKLNRIEDEIVEAEKEIVRLESEIDSLRNNLSKIEQLAREKFNMLRKSERAIKFEIEKQN